MLKAVQSRLSLQMAMIGLHLLRLSGLYNSYFGRWRFAMFDRAQQAGLHVTPVHYYTPIPDTSALAFDDATPRYLAAGEDALDEAMEDLTAIATRYANTFSRIASRPRSETVEDFRFGKAPYSTVEAETLYGLIRSRRPGKVVEIGCGHTTFLIAEAIRDEDGYAPDYTCIEPYRPDYLKTPPTEVSRFIDQPLQDVPLETFQDLEAGDILFIDSSHVVAYGSDTVHELTTILPVLKPGVLVHIHDIFLPYEYPTKWLKESRFFWAEQYMLSTLMRDNPRYRILFPLHQLYRQRRAPLQALFPLLEDPAHVPGAYWIEIAG